MHRVIAMTDSYGSCPPREGRHVPVGRGGRAPGVVRGDPGAGSVGCERRRAPGDRSPRADGSGIEPRRTVMVAVRSGEKSRIGPYGVHPGVRGESGPPDALILPTIPWIRAYCPSPIGLQEARAGSPRARSAPSGKSQYKMGKAPGRILVCVTVLMPVNLAVLHAAGVLGPQPCAVSRRDSAAAPVPVPDDGADESPQAEEPPDRSAPAR